jgi:hypothetical protein
MKIIKTTVRIAGRERNMRRREMMRRGGSGGEGFVDGIGGAVPAWDFGSEGAA